MRAGIADVFGERGPGLRIADHMALVAFDDRGIPVGRIAARQCQHSGEQRHFDRFHCAFSSFSPRLRASDSSTVRNSGSPMSRKLSPSSIGMGLSEGGALAPSSTCAGLTAPCRNLTLATAL